MPERPARLDAIAATRLRAEGRVAIIDVDVHHGNGTQDVFWTDAGVLHAVEVACEMVAALDPTTVVVSLVVSLGLDTAAEDPIGQPELSAAGFARLGLLLAALDRPTVLVQEGGYALASLGRAAVDALTAFRAPAGPT